MSYELEDVERRGIKNVMQNDHILEYGEGTTSTEPFRFSQFCK